MKKFLFVLSRGPEDSTRAVRCFQFAKIAAEKGHEHAPVEHGQHVIGKVALHFHQAEELLNADGAYAAPGNACRKYFRRTVLQAG